MPQRFNRRPLQPGNPEVIPYFADNARRDPRLFARGFSPAVQPDEISLDDIREARNGRVVPMQDVVDDLGAHNLPPQLVQSSFLVVLTEFGVAGAQLLIPKNPNRSSFLVSNFIGTNSCMFSFDKPLNVGANIGAGIPLGGCYQEANGSVSINDIWVFCNDSAETYPVTLLGYEGGLSIAGNKR